MINILSTNPTNIGHVSLKINPIQSAYYKHSYPGKMSQKLTTRPDPDTILAPMPDNYGRAIVFNGIGNKLVTNAPFEDKLALGIKELILTGKMGGYLLAAKNMKAVQELLQYLEIPIPIKKLILITDNKLKDSLLFSRIGNSVTFINTNNHEVVTSSPELLFPGESTNIFLGERLRLSTGWIDLKEEPNADLNLEEHSSEFMKILDYTKNLDDLYLKHNIDVIKFVKEMDKPKTKANGLTFDNIGGQDEVIDALRKNILFPLKYPEVFEGFMMSRGAILYGPPGTGKTLIAKTLAAESGASIFEMCATEFSAKYVGESEENCRKLFQQAIDAQPSIIYLDEIEALGSQRGKDTYGDKLLAQFLSSMSELEKRGDQVFIIGSTNRKEDLDPAFTRSGRFSTLLEVKAPDLEGTKQIFDIHTKEKPLDENIDKDFIVNKMFAKKMTGADIAATVKEAFSNTLTRTGIYESMANGRYSPIMKEYLKITTEDFKKAIENFKNNSTKWATIGYNK